MASNCETHESSLRKPDLHGEKIEFDSKYKVYHKCIFKISCHK